MSVSGLVPARFLTLIAHLILTIVLYWSISANIQACLPLSYTQSQYDNINTQLIIGISVAIGLFVFELIGFFAGVSMFMQSQAMISLAAHSGGAIALSFYMFESQPCNNFWFIFGFTNALPAVTEIITFLAVLCCRRGPW